VDPPLANERREYPVEGVDERMDDRCWLVLLLRLDKLLRQVCYRIQVLVLGCFDLLLVLLDLTELLLNRFLVHCRFV
jgi:hypothetical protein